MPDQRPSGHPFPGRGPAVAGTLATPDQPAADTRDSSAVHGVADRVRAVYGQRVGPAEQSLLVAWLGFGVTFGLTRAVTHALRRLAGGGGMSAGGRHLHHYNLGIALLAGVGAVALRGAEEHRRHPVNALAYGAGTALIVDELALLLDLQDVYWSQDGRKSVDLAVGLIALGGLYLAAIPFWHGAARELRRRP